MGIPDLSKRLFQQEQLDQLDLKGSSLDTTLKELAIINRYLGNAKAMSKRVLRKALQIKSPQVVIVDLGCGGGDLLRTIDKALNQNGISYRLIGIDGNPHILNYAALQSSHLEKVSYQQADIMSSDFLVPECDILISSHFLYHFKDKALIRFLSRQQYQVSECFLLSELQRSTLAWVLFRIIAPLLNLSKLTQEDGLLAIRRAFRRNELDVILEAVKFKSWQIQWKWAFHYIIEISSNHHLSEHPKN